VLRDLPGGTSQLPTGAASPRDRVVESHAGSMEAGRLTKVLSAPVLQCCKRLHTHPKEKKAGKCIRVA